MSSELRFVSPRRPSSSSDLAAQGRLLFIISTSFLVFGIFTSLGGWEYLLFHSSHPPNFSLTRVESIARSAEDPSFIRWPYALFYFTPLVVPLTLYVVIARWTGEQYFKYS